MTENPNLVDVIGALALQADLCMNQLSEVEMCMAEWQAGGCSNKDFPLNDYQKIDLIKQRLSDIQAVLSHASNDQHKVFSDVKLCWEKLNEHIVLGETRAAIAQGSVAIDEAESANGNLTIF